MKLNSPKVKYNKSKGDDSLKYMGSKNRLAKELVPIIQSYINKDTKGYLEPFVGGANVIDKVKCEKKYGSDNHKYLIEFLDALSKGYEPPKHISEEEYKYIKTHQEEYEAKFLGYVGFQLSYGAKWFDTFRRDKQGKRKYDEEAYRNVMKQAPNLKGIKFKCCSFQDLPKEKINGYVIYCDPPYKGTAKYSTGEFQYEEFYEWCREMSKNNIVLISEYDMPEDFECIWEKEHKCLLYSEKKSCDDKNERIERLYTYKAS